VPVAFDSGLNEALKEVSQEIALGGQSEHSSAFVDFLHFRASALKD
jgi:hypothetical protein